MNIKIKYILLIISLLVANLTLNGQIIQVRLFNSLKVKTFAISSNEGKYQIYTNKDRPYKIRRNKMFYISVVGDKISLWDNDDLMGMYDTINIMGISKKNVMKIELGNPDMPIRYYHGDLQVTTNNNRLMVDNIVHIDDYLAGVIEAEAGYNAPFEYYKVQAIISRTYLYNIIHKLSENKTDNSYFIGDDVSFQVYKGVSKMETNIKQAVINTKGLVIIDTTFAFITAVFHSNSGGYTANSEDVWLSSRSYLKKTDDPFSLNQRNSLWTVKIPIKNWLRYFNQLGIDTNNIDNRQKIINILQDKRLKYLVINNDTVLLKNIRHHFKLKSAWFSTTQQNNDVLINGRGYGHGVGLSQQGAMQMAKENYSFLDIIYYYYKNVKVVHINTVFFRNSTF